MNFMEAQAHNHHTSLRYFLFIHHQIKHNNGEDNRSSRKWLRQLTNTNERLSEKQELLN
ncbi:hypothetical protein SESBI_27110 [Sesbania bispinosa]|nr:hypothetical protein SESBI_27110 [Sesbania bispinosa]